VLHPGAKDLIQQRMQDVAREQGLPFEPDRPDNQHRLNMGVFPQGAELIANPYNKIPGFSVGQVHFVPGFPVMAHPMIESLLDGRYAALHGGQVQTELSVVVYGGDGSVADAADGSASKRALPASRSSACPAWTTPCTAATSNWVSRAEATPCRRPTRRCARA
jgi:molybdopterin-biosynthesis enzyme MoeA-like protein